MTICYLNTTKFDDSHNTKNIVGVLLLCKPFSHVQSTTSYYTGSQVESVLKIGKFLVLFYFFILFFWLKWYDELKIVIKYT